MTDLITINSVRGRMTDDGTVELNLEDVSRGLGIVKRETKNGVQYERINKQALAGWLMEFGILNSENTVVPTSVHSGVHTSVESKNSQLVGKDGLPEFIPENIFYKLCFKASNEAARAFQDKVTDEILPAIRKHGGYIPVIEGETNEHLMARALLIAQDTIAEKDALLAAQAPKVLFADAVSASEDCVLVRELSKFLNQNGVDIGEKRLYEWLRRGGYLIRKNGRDRNSPSQRSMDMGLFRVKETTREDEDGKPRIDRTTVVTGKGQQYFLGKFLAQSEFGEGGEEQDVDAAA